MTFSAGKEVGKLAPPTEFRRARLVADFREMFGKIWSPVSRTLAEMLIRQALSPPKTAHADKPRTMICLRHGRVCIGAIVLLPKRGGAMKGLLLRKTGHEPSIRQLIQGAVDLAGSLGARKVYFLHPILDQFTIGVLRVSHFRPEGLLRAPYRPGQDMIVLSRLI